MEILGLILKIVLLLGLIMAGLAVLSAVILIAFRPKLLKAANEAKGKDEQEEETVGIGSKL